MEKRRIVLKKKNFEVYYITSHLVPVEHWQPSPSRSSCTLSKNILMPVAEHFFPDDRTD
jgi:hypothetical protein